MNENAFDREVNFTGLSRKITLQHGAVLYCIIINILLWSISNIQKQSTWYNHTCIHHWVVWETPCQTYSYCGLSRKRQTANFR